jgi:hypothetical protein
MTTERMIAMLRAMTQCNWETLLSGGVPLNEIVIHGDGKDLYMKISLANGQVLSMGAGDVSSLRPPR